MAQNFLPCDRDQELMLPPSLREWLPEDHLALLLYAYSNGVRLRDTLREQALTEDPRGAAQAAST